MFVETYSYISIYDFGFDACRALHVCLQVDGCMPLGEEVEAAADAAQALYQMLRLK
jgi:hypothetical protein